MIKSLFLDSDIIIDLLAKREPFYEFAAKIFTLAYEKKLKLYTSPVVLSNLFYVLRKIKGYNKTERLIKNLRLVISILPIDEKIVDLTLNSNFSDFEDGLQYHTAKEHSIFSLITRNKKDYKVKDIIVQTAEEFLKMNTV
ncbi:MAG: PIN domain-containing protein [Treponema sp.]|nr:PIN domain-containing protein [Treponema sp.]